MVVGLTGGAASGKSLVSAELKRLGASVVDADVIAREVLRPGEPAYEGVVGFFGRGILKEDGAIDRKALGHVVFSEPEKLKVLNGITHPEIRKRIRQEVEELREKSPLVVVDAALLMESGLYKEMDAVVVVYADESAQMERMMKRDGLAEAEALARIRAQMPIEEKRARADFVIDNSADAAETIAQTRSLYGKLSA